MKSIDFFYGVILARIVYSKTVCLKRYEGNKSSYVVEDRIGIYVKYSSKRLSPWHFSFSKTHIEEIKKMKNDCELIFIVLVCNDDGICCLDFKELCTVFSIENRSFPKWIKVSRSKGQKYAVSGRDGRLKHKIGNSDFPRKIY